MNLKVPECIIGLTNSNKNNYNNITNNSNTAITLTSTLTITITLKIIITVTTSAIKYYRGFPELKEFQESKLSSTTVTSLTISASTTYLLRPSRVP